MQCVLLVYSTWIYRHYECFSKSASHCRSLSALYVIGSFCIRPKLFTWNARNLLVKMISVVPVSLYDLIYYGKFSIVLQVHTFNGEPENMLYHIEIYPISMSYREATKRAIPIEFGSLRMSQFSENNHLSNIYRYKLQRSNAFKCICFFVPKIDANWFNWDAWHTLNFRNW